MIPMRSLGQGLKVSAIGYGAMGLSFGYGPPTEREQAVAVIRKYGFNRVGVVGAPTQPAMSYLYVSLEPERQKLVGGPLLAEAFSHTGEGGRAVSIGQASQQPTTIDFEEQRYHPAPYPTAASSAITSRGPAADVEDVLTLNRDTSRCSTRAA